MIHSHKLSADPFTDPFSVTQQTQQPDAATRAWSLLELRRRAFGGTLAVMWHEITHNASKHARGLIFFVTVAMVAWAALSVVILAKASGGQVVTPVPTFAPIVHIQTTATPIAIQKTITADSINAAMPADSQTVVLSVQPSHLQPSQQAQIDQQVIITSPLIGAGVFGYYDDRLDGDMSYSCPDNLCGKYDPNRKVYLCGGWAAMGAYSQTVQPVFSIINNTHICIAAERIPQTKGQAIGMLSTSARRLLVGTTQLWPLLVIEVYADKSPYPIASLGK